MIIIDKNSLLNAAQKNLLQGCAQIPFSLGKFASIDEILTKLKVNVIIEPGIVTRTIPLELEEALKFWENETNRLKETNFEESKEAWEKYNFILKDKGVWRSMPLRGLYDPKAKVIKLYPEEMRQEYGGNCMDELLVSTLVHEAMHAYFNRPRHKSFPYVIFVEEPLAEFGMLLHFKETGSKYYDWAFADVSNKKTVYKYGANLMNQCLAEGANSPTRKYLEKYKVKLNVYDIPDFYGVGGTITISGISSVSVNGQRITPKWKIFNPPCYFYDPTNKILGLDGDWSEVRRKIIKYHYIDNIHNIINKPINTVYLEDNFSLDDYFPIFDDLFSQHDVQVSPKNKLFKSISIKFFSTTISIPIFIKDNTPALDSCGKGYYRICRNGKWGVIDEQLTPIIDFKYDFIWQIDKNELFLVKFVVNKKDNYGLVNKQGVEQVKPIYDFIYNMNPDGTYIVKKDGEEFKIDKTGN